MWQLILVVLAVVMTAGLQTETRCETAFVKAEKELWVKTANSASRLIKDGRGVQFPRWSPDGALLAYAHEADTASDPVTSLVVIDRAGKVLRQIPVTYSDGINAVLDVGWKSNDVVWLVGHATPSSSIYHDWDIHTGEQLSEQWGAFFTWSPDGKALAFRDHVPHGAPEGYRVPLMINGETVPISGQLPKDGRVIGPFAWSPNSSMLAVPVETRDNLYLMFVTRDRKTQAVARIDSAEHPSSISWAGDDAVNISVDTRRGFRVSAKNGSVEATQPIEAAAAKATSSTFCGATKSRE